MGKDLALTFYAFLLRSNAMSPPTTAPRPAAPAEVFEPAQPPEPKIFSIVVDAVIEGFTVHITVDQAVSRMPNFLQRLKEIGVQPTQRVPPATGANGATFVKSAAPRMQPAYLADGTPTCPIHGKALKDGNFGPYCSAKGEPGSEYINDKGYCKIKFDD
jgi:hypothetical protein